MSNVLKFTKKLSPELAFKNTIIELPIGDYVSYKLSKDEIKRYRKIVYALNRRKSIPCKYKTMMLGNFFYVWCYTPSNDSVSTSTATNERTTYA